MTKERNGARRLCVLLALAVAAGCTDRPHPLDPGGEVEKPPVSVTPGDPVTVAVLDCTANVQTLSVTCASPAPEAGGGDPGALIVGGQGVYVRAISSNVSYNSATGRFTFDVAIQNLIPQPLGTTDGVTLDPAGVRLFFHSGPSLTGGGGVAAVVPDGFADFTAAGQPFYQYDEVLLRDEVSPARQWMLIVSPTVTTAVFQVYVSAAVPHPNGYVELNGQLPGALFDPLHPGSALPLVAVVRSAIGSVVPGVPVVFSTSDPACATVTPGGEVTGVRAATCTITASGGGRSGSAVFPVTGTVRSWTGSASSDWNDGSNWAGALVPAEVDSVAIPTGVPNYPALTSAVTIGGVEVADGATLSLGAFPLLATQDVATGPTAGSGIVATGGTLVLSGAGKSVRGRVPSLQVTGAYSLSGDLFVVAPETVDAGSMTSESFELQIVAQ